MSGKDFIYKENDNIYLNIIFDTPIVNSTGGPTGPTTGEQPIVMEYTANKTLAIVDKCSDYYCSVIRFDIPLQKIPIFIMPIVPGTQQSTTPTNPNLTPLIIGIFYNNVYYPVNLIYTPDNNGTPPVQSQSTQVITPYYYVYSQQLLINMFNIALAFAWTNSGLEALFGSFSEPYFNYDPVTELISIIVPQPFAFLTAPATSIPLIFINESSVRYLESFELFFNGYNRLYGADYFFRFTSTTPLNPTNIEPPPIFPTNQNSYALFGTTPTPIASYYIYTEQYPIIQYWSSLRKILITTGTIPIAFENVPSNNNTDSAVSLPILTDYVIPLEHAGDGRTIAYYNPTSQYRLIDMLTDSPLYKINVKVYWEDIYTNRYPLTIGINQNASIKMGFFRKSLYKASRLLK